MQSPTWLKSDAYDVLIIAQIKTGQKQSKILATSKSLIILVTSPPIKGKANKEILKLLKKCLKKEIRLYKGETSSTKVFQVKNATMEDILQKFGIS